MKDEVQLCGLLFFILQPSAYILGFKPPMSSRRRGNFEVGTYIIRFSRHIHSPG